jgi:AcrR family transcriptional regulator
LILAATRELLAETGNQGAVSVRAVAERVGVTTPSIYRHFKDKDDLMDAVCKEVFETLADELEKAATSADGPLDRLFAQGRAYIDFALANPEEYRIVFMGECRPKNTDAFITERCFTQVVETVQACTEAGLFAPSAAGLADVAVRLWACVHGLASLLICKPWLPWGDRGAVVQRALLMAAAGASLEGRLTGQPVPRVAQEMATLAGGFPPLPSAGAASQNSRTRNPRGGGAKRRPTSGSPPGGRCAS